MVIAPGALSELDRISDDDTEAAMQAAARNDQLPGPLLPLRGTLSRPRQHPTTRIPAQIPR